jgi:RNA polymerase sigma factor (sigma-70 family)
MNEQYEDQKLWNDFTTGCDRAFRLLFDKYANRLFVFGMNFTGDEETVKDCVQDLFVKLYAERGNLPPVSNVKAYLFNSLKHRLLNLQRDKVEFCTVETALAEESDDPSPESLLIMEEKALEQKREVERLFAEITPRQREILYYRYVEELPYEDICKLMQMNYQSVRNLLHRTVTKLRTLKKMQPDLSTKP